MIVPMKKVSLVVLEKERQSALEKLQEAGVVHLEKRGIVTDDLSRLTDQRAKAENAQGLLLQYEEKKKKKNAAPLANGDEVIAQTLALSDERKSLQEQLVAAGKEESRLEKWGNFNPEGLKELEGAGLKLIPYELDPKTFAGLPPEQEIIVLSQDKRWVRLLAVGKEIEGETPFNVPEKSLREIEEGVSVMQARIAVIDGELTRLAVYGKAVAESIARLKAQVEFESVRADMETLDQSAVALSWLTGYVPKDDLGVLKRVSAENGWALLADDPGPDDNVPTKLKNNALASLIYPLTDFLEVVPGYHETDISGWFLFFFVIFFGMIFGDAGYGSLLLITGIVVALKTAKKGVPQAIKMLILLSISNVVWGVLTCTWFGMDTALLPEALKNISLPLISGAVAARSEADSAIVDQNLMIFCFSLALLHLCIGHIIALMNKLKAKSLKFLNDLGNIAMLIGMYNVVLFLVVSNDNRAIPLLPAALYLLIGGFALTFVFSNYDGSIGRSILDSLKNIIATILGITNVFSDIMSYIRLWAVGLAGASISSTINTLAGPLLGNFLVFLGIILLVFGHGLNIVLNTLSVLIHGVRLNTLEFSSHVELSWSGTAYRPFAKR
jgi:V/A-type H+-transporting ATPase subunit I